MERVNIRTAETWRRFDFWAIVIVIALILLLWWMWFKNMGPGSENCCQGDQADRAEAAEAVALEPEAVVETPVVVAPEPMPPAPATEPLVTATEDYALAFSRQGRRVVLSGEVADQATLDGIVAAARQAFGDDEIVSELTINPAVKAFDGGSLPGLFGSMNAITDARLAVSPDQWKLTGSVDSEDDAGLLSQSLSQGLPAELLAKFSNEVEVIAPVDCQAIVNGVSIEFATGKSALTDAGKRQILRLLDCLKSNSFEIVGHTDSVGDANFNRELSLKRATAVREYLDEIGIDTSNVVVTGKGEDQMLVDDQGRGDARNRRIEFKIN